MGKKKETLDFSNQNSMNVEVLIVEDEKKKVSKMAFAHLPKEIKKLLRPI